MEEGGVEMYRDRGIYVFPDKDKKRIFAYDENTAAYPSLTWKNGNVSDEEILKVVHELD